MIGSEKGVNFVQWQNFWFSIAHNIKAVIATVLKPGMVTDYSIIVLRLQKSLQPPTSGMGVVKNSHVMPHFGAPSF